MDDEKGGRILRLAKEALRECLHVMSKVIFIMKW